MIGNPQAFCQKPEMEGVPECRVDSDCGSGLACIDAVCQNPCAVLDPCHPTARCHVIDSVPVRTMTCVCPEGWVPDQQGQCKPSKYNPKSTY